MIFTFQRLETTEKGMSPDLNAYAFNNNCNNVFDLILFHNKVIISRCEVIIFIIK